MALEPNLVFSEDRTQESREAKAAKICRADTEGEMHKMRAPEICIGNLLNLQLSRLSTEDATQGQGMITELEKTIFGTHAGPRIVPVPINHLKIS